VQPNGLRIISLVACSVEMVVQALVYNSSIYICAERSFHWWASVRYLVNL